MIIYCDNCNFKRDYGEKLPPRSCPWCNGWDLWFEKNDDWNQLSGLWALGNGWLGQGSDRQPYYQSLPEWFFRQFKVREWEVFVELLTNPKIIAPPPESSREHMIEFWLQRTGMPRIWERAAKYAAATMGAVAYKLPPLINACWNYEIIRVLGEAYVNLWEGKEYIAINTRAESHPDISPPLHTGTRYREINHLFNLFFFLGVLRRERKGRKLFFFWTDLAKKGNWPDWFRKGVDPEITRRLVELVGKNFVT